MTAGIDSCFGGGIKQLLVGITYKKDKNHIIESIKKLIEAGEYNMDLFSDLI